MQVICWKLATHFKTWYWPYLDAVLQTPQEVLVRLLQDSQVLLLLHRLDPPVGNVLMSGIDLTFVKLVKLRLSFWKMRIKIPEDQSSAPNARQSIKWSHCPSKDCPVTAHSYTKTAKRNILNLRHFLIWVVTRREQCNWGCHWHWHFVGGIDGHWHWMKLLTLRSEVLNLL